MSQSMNGVDYSTENLTVNNISCNNISSNNISSDGILTNTITSSSITSSSISSAILDITNGITSASLTTQNIVSAIINNVGLITAGSGLITFLNATNIIVSQFFKATNALITNRLTVDNEIYCGKIYYNAIRDPADLTGTLYDATTDLSKTIDLIRKDCGNDITTGFNNSILGNFNAPRLQTGNSNVIFGNDCLPFLINGSFNTCIGVDNGYGITGNNNTIIGHQANGDESLGQIFNRSTAIGYNSSITNSDQVVLGDSNSQTVINKLLVNDDAYFVSIPVCPIEPTQANHLTNKSYVDEIKLYIDLKFRNQKRGIQVVNQPTGISTVHLVGFFEPFPLNKQINIVISPRYFESANFRITNLYVDEITTEGFSFIYEFENTSGGLQSNYSEIHWTATTIED